ncbi:MAG: hypothetical protein ACK41F_14370 [Fimbriimonadaceae bacterium]
MKATPLLTPIALAGLLAAPIAHAQLGVVGQVGGATTGTLQGGLGAGPRMIDQRAIVDGTQTLRGRLEAQHRAERERSLRNATLPTLDAAPAMPTAPELGSLPAAPTAPALPAVPTADGLPTPALPALTDRPVTGSPGEGAAEATPPRRGFLGRLLGRGDARITASADARANGDAEAGIEHGENEAATPSARASANASASVSANAGAHAGRRDGTER